MRCQHDTYSEYKHALMYLLYSWQMLVGVEATAEEVAEYLGKDILPDRFSSLH